MNISEYTWTIILNVCKILVMLTLETWRIESTSRLGPIHSAAPEIWLWKPYDGPKVDVWAAGVCLVAVIKTPASLTSWPKHRILVQLDWSGKRLSRAWISGEAW